MERRTWQIGWMLFLLLGLGVISYGQDGRELGNLDAALIAQVNQGSSYVTFPTDIGNIERLMFEASIVPNFTLRKNKASRFVGVLTPQIIIRMYNEFSHPVRTPSYMPQLTGYYMIGNRLDENLFTIYGRLAHHSNGQEDTLVLDNGQINMFSGDFATNYLELGGIVTSFKRSTNAVRFFKASYEYHPENDVHELYFGRYSRHRLNLSFSAFKLPKGEDQKGKARFSFDLKTTLLFGDMAGLSTLSLDRLQTNLTLSYYPLFMEDIGLFVSFYHGKDYYNVYYDNTRNLLRFGLITNKLRF